MMDRRAFIALVGGSMLAAPLAPEAQLAGKVARVGLLSVGATESPEQVARWRLPLALRDLGWIAGQNIVFESRFAAGYTDRLPALAAELVRLKVDVFVTVFNQETLAAKQATDSIPIVMLLGIFPVEVGLVASLARPGGNVTGTSVAPMASGKYFELLKEAVPRLMRVGVLWDPSSLSRLEYPSALESPGVEALNLGLTLVSIEVRRPNDVEGALARIVSDRPGALLVIPTGPLAPRTAELIDFAAKQRMPTIYPSRTFVDAGALMSYGYDRDELAKRAARQIDRILKGARPADLPVEQSTKIELVINLKTAKALGLTIPQTLLLRADQVIE